MTKANSPEHEQLDRVGRLVLGAAAAVDSEIETAAAAPFLFTRVRAAIAQEKRRRDEMGSWLSLFSVARRAIPGMAALAMLSAIITVLTVQVSVPAARFDEDAFFDARDNGVEQTILANRNGLTRDEVFNIVVDRSDGRSTR